MKLVVDGASDRVRRRAHGRAGRGRDHPGHRGGAEGGRHQGVVRRDHRHPSDGGRGIRDDARAGALSRGRRRAAAATQLLVAMRWFSWIASSRMRPDSVSSASGSSSCALSSPSGIGSGIGVFRVVQRCLVVLLELVDRGERLQALGHAPAVLERQLRLALLAALREAHRFAERDRGDGVALLGQRDLVAQVAEVGVLLRARLVPLAQRGQQRAPGPGTCGAAPARCGPRAGRCRASSRRPRRGRRSRAARCRAPRRGAACSRRRCGRTSTPSSSAGRGSAGSATAPCPCRRTACPTTRPRP